MTTLLSEFAQIPVPELTGTNDQAIGYSDNNHMASICGANTWEDIECYGHSKYDWRKHSLVADGPV